MGEITRQIVSYQGGKSSLFTTHDIWYISRLSERPTSGGLWCCLCFSHTRRGLAEEFSWPSLRPGLEALSRYPPPRRCHRGPCLSPASGLNCESCPRRGWRGEAHTRTAWVAACPPVWDPASPWSLASNGLTWLYSWVTVIMSHWTLHVCTVWTPGTNWGPMMICWHWEGQLATRQLWAGTGYWALYTSAVPGSRAS